MKEKNIFILEKMGFGTVSQSKVRKQRNFSYFFKPNANKARVCAHTAGLREEGYTQRSMYWARLVALDGRIVSKCERCIREGTGMLPNYGKLLRGKHECVCCGEVRQPVILFISILPYPEGEAKKVCLRCFERFGNA